MSKELEPAIADAPVADAERASDLDATPWVVSTYFAEGLPFSIVHQVSTQLFTALGVSLGGIGLTSLYGLAWNLKFAWSPLVERTSTLRRWIVALEIALGLFVLALALTTGATDLRKAASLLGCVAVLAATHDVAIDGFYLRALSRAKQTSLSGLRVGAYRAALLVGGGLLVVVAGRTSWSWCFVGAGAILLALAAWHALSLPHVEPTAASVPLHSGRAIEPVARPTFVSAFTSFFKANGAKVVAFIVLFRAGDAMMFAMATPLLKTLGLETAARGVLSGVGGTTASVAGSMIGAALISKKGLGQTLLPMMLIQSLAIPLYAIMAWAHPSTAWIAIIVVAEQLAAGVGTAAFIVFLTRRCVVVEHRTAHFAIASGLMSIATTVLGASSGYVAEWVGFPVFFTIAFVASIPGVLLARSVPTE